MKFSFNFSGSKECVLSVELNFISIDSTFQTFQSLLITTLHHNDELGVATIFSNSLLESISKRFSRLHQEQFATEGNVTVNGMNAMLRL